jgi:UDP-sugar pyrophosphorylase
MTSEDTDSGTRSLLTEHKYFGMVAEQIVVLMQEKVPALKNSKAHFELTGKDSYELATRPHGHGDIHNLLFQTSMLHVVAFAIQSTNVAHSKLLLCEPYYG